MKRGVTGACMAAMLSFGAAAYAQTTGQTPPPTTGTPTQPSTRMGADQNQEQQVTITGCIQRESDYRQAQQQGRGGTMGTGLGAGNEFVLVNASMGASGSQSGMAGTASGTTASGTTASGTTATGTTSSGTTAGTTSGTTPETAAGTTGTAGSAMGRSGSAFRLTGDRESELEKYVGQRVEIVGKVEGGQGAAARGTSGTSGTAGASAPAGANADFNSLREIDITSFRAVGGTCGAQ